VVIAAKLVLGWVGKILAYCQLFILTTLIDFMTHMLHGGVQCYFFQHFVLCFILGCCEYDNSSVHLQCVGVIFALGFFIVLELDT
jgi:hypothetical protein